MSHTLRGEFAQRLGGMGAVVPRSATVDVTEGTGGLLDGLG